MLFLKLIFRDEIHLYAKFLFYIFSHCLKFFTLSDSRHTLVVQKRRIIGAKKWLYFARKSTFEA